MLAERRLPLRIGNLGFATGVDRRQAGGQPQVRNQFEVVADMQHSIGAQVAVVTGLGAWRVASGVAGRRAHVFRGTVVGHRLGGAQADGGFAVVAEQRVLADVIEGAADVGVGDFQPVGAFAQVHRVVVVRQANFDPGAVIQLQGGFVGDPGRPRLQALGIAGGVEAVGRAWVVADLAAREFARGVVGGFAVAEVEAGFQVRVEPVAEVRRHALAGGGALPLVAVGLGVGEANVVVGIPEHLARADFALGITFAAGFIAQLQLGRVVAGTRHVVDGAAEGQGALVKAVGATQHLDAALPQRVFQLIRCAAGAGQRQAVEHFVQAGGMGTGAAVQARTTNREFHPFVVRRLGVYPGLVLEYVFVGAHPPLLHAVHVDVIGAAGHALELRLGHFPRTGFAAGDFDRGQLQVFGMHQ